jgi:hypothetical protein
MFGLVVFFAAIIAFAVVSVRYGVDSRRDSTDPRSPESPVDIL